MTERNTVLVTGASGLVGSEVVARLRGRGVDVVALTHRKPHVVDSNGDRTEMEPFGVGGSNTAGASYVQGDVRSADFGLDAATVAALGEQVGRIVHCAATTDFAAPERDYAELNVGGTEHAAALARAWDVPLVYVSTAYVCGRREGTIDENDLSDEYSFGNGYEKSKYTAEQNVRSTSGLRWAIVRPGIVTGCAETGAIRDYKNLYTVVKLIVEGKLCTLPGRYDATLSLAPVDYVADAVVAAVTNFESAEGKTIHAVGDTPLSLRDMSEIFAEYPSFEVARFVPGTSFSVDDLDVIEQEYYRRIGAQYASYFDGKRTFSTVNARELVGTPPETGKDYLRELLDYCLETGYLGAPLTSIEEVVTCSS